MKIENLKKLFQNKALNDMSIVYASSLINGFSLFAINIILGRILSQNLFGIFTLSILVLSVVTEMSDFGLNGGLLRFAPYYINNKEDSKLKQLIKTVWGWRVWMSFFITASGILLSPLIATYLFNRPEISNYFMLSFLGVGGVVMLGFLVAFLQASNNFFLSATLTSLKGLVRLMLIILMYILGVRNLYVYILIYIMIPWILFLLSYKRLPTNFKNVVIDDSIKKSIHSKLAKFSFWLTIWSFSAILSSRIDQIMLSRLLGLDKVAIYSVSFQFIFFYTTAMQAVSTVLTPRINSIKEKKELIVFIKKIWKWILPASLFICLIIYPSKFLITFLFGVKYLDSMPVYIILSYSMVLSFIGVPLSLVILAFNKSKLIAISGFMQLIISFIFNLILIPKYGVIGAGITFALGIVASLMYNLVCSVYLLKHKNNIIL